MIILISAILIFKVIKYDINNSISYFVKSKEIYKFQIMDGFKDVLHWLEEERIRVNYFVNKISIQNLDSWSYSKSKGLFYHKSGGFFKLEALKVNIFNGKTYDWDQPIINQDEIGLLGFLMKEVNNEYYFLTQAKIEPGNINGVQLNP